MKALPLKENEQRALMALKEALLERFGLVELRLFGSKARGQATFESDIDVMIKLPETNPEIESQIDDIIFDLNIENDCFISATFFSRKEIEEGPLSESPLYKAIQREGAPI